jgi:hypothetical protein
VTCPDILAGTVSDQAGFFTGLADAATLERSGSYTWQWPALASDRPGVCERQRAAMAATGQWLVKEAGETWLMVILFGYNSIPGTAESDLTNFSTPPPPPVPITLQNATGLEAPAGSGHAYSVRATYQGPKGSSQSATAGTATFTRADGELFEVAYDFTFKAGRLQGHMTAPYCVIC